MLITEWNTETALNVRYEEGMEVGIEVGREESIEATAKKALAEGLPIEVIQKITGLSPEIIKQLAIRNGSQSTTSP